MTYTPRRVDPPEHTLECRSFFGMKCPECRGNGVIPTRWYEGLPVKFDDCDSCDHTGVVSQPCDCQEGPDCDPGL